MTHNRMRLTVFLMLLIVALPDIGQAQPRRGESQGAQETLRELDRLFQDYPPSLRRVFQLDPSLLTNPNYLSNYPALAEFLRNHPEIAHNPEYYIGQFRPPEPQVRPIPEDPMVRVWQDTIDWMAGGVVMFAVIGALIFAIRSIVDHRRWLRVSRIQTEAHSKLLDRFTSNEDLMTYINTPAGRRFLESAPISIAGKSEISAPVSRILWSIQLGLVFAFLGLGLQFVSNRIAERISAMFYFFGVLAIALGVGFILSAVASYLIAEKLGLFEKSSIKTSTEKTTPETSSS